MESVVLNKYNTGEQTLSRPPFILTDALDEAGREITLLQVSARLQVLTSRALAAHLIALRDKPIAGVLAPLEVLQENDELTVVYPRFSPTSFHPESLSMGEIAAVCESVHHTVAGLHKRGLQLGVLVRESVVRVEEQVLLVDLGWEPLITRLEPNAMASCAPAMAPELQAQKAKPTVASDIYSLACWCAGCDKSFQSTKWFAVCTSANPAARPSSAVESLRLLQEELATTRVPTTAFSPAVIAEDPAVNGHVPGPEPTMEHAAEAFTVTGGPQVSAATVEHSEPAVTAQGPVTGTLDSATSTRSSRGIEPKGVVVTPEPIIYTPGAIPTLPGSAGQSASLEDFAAAKTAREAAVAKAKQLNMIMYVIAAALLIASYLTADAIFGELAPSGGEANRTSSSENQV